MRRDFLFLVTGLPPNKLVQGKNFLAVSLDKSITSILEKLAEDEPSILEITRVPDGKAFGIVIRNELESDRQAAIDAWRTVSGIIDVYTIATESMPPRISRQFFMREEDSPDISLKSFAESLVFSFASNKAEPERAAKYEKCKEQVMQRMMQLFDFAGHVPRSDSPFVHQLLYSARMFRHGAESGVIGIQFLSKFSALEGLVCGGETYRKKQLLTDRLLPLFKSISGIDEAKIKRLWELRCEASHQAKAFEFDEDPTTNNHGPYVMDVDRLFLGSLIFALDHADRVRTIYDLWNNHLQKYQLPEYATYRPTDFHRIVATSVLLNKGTMIKEVGQSFDQFHKPEELSQGGVC